MPSIDATTLHAAMNGDDVLTAIASKRRRPGRRERSKDIEDISFRSDKVKPSRKQSTENKESDMTATAIEQTQTNEIPVAEQSKAATEVKTTTPVQPVVQEEAIQDKTQSPKEDRSEALVIAVRSLKNGAIAQMGTDSWRNIIEHAQKALLKDNRKSIIPFMQTGTIINEESQDVVRRSLMRGLLRHLSKSIGMFCELDHEDGMTLRLLSLKSNDWAVFKVQTVSAEVKLTAEVKTGNNKVACLSSYEADHLSLTNLTTQEFLTVLDDCLAIHLKMIAEMITEPIAKALAEGLKKAANS